MERPLKSRAFISESGALIQLKQGGERICDELIDMYRTFPAEHKSLGLPPESDTALKQWLTSLFERGCHFLAFHEKNCIGHAAYAPESADTPVLIAFVHPKYHDRGIGTELVGYAIDVATSRGHDALYLDVGHDNERAIHVYRKHGFRIKDESVGSKRMWLEL